MYAWRCRPLVRFKLKKVMIWTETMQLLQRKSIARSPCEVSRRSVLALSSTAWSGTAMLSACALSVSCDMFSGSVKGMDQCRRARRVLIRHLIASIPHHSCAQRWLPRLLELTRLREVWLKIQKSRRLVGWQTVNTVSPHRAMGSPSASTCSRQDVYLERTWTLWHVNLNVTCVRTCCVVHMVEQMSLPILMRLRAHIRTTMEMSVKRAPGVSVSRAPIPHGVGSLQCGHPLRHARTCSPLRTLTEARIHQRAHKSMLSGSLLRSCHDPPILMSLFVKTSVPHLSWRVRNTFLEFRDDSEFCVDTFSACSKRSASTDSALTRCISADTFGGPRAFRDGPFVKRAEIFESTSACEDSCQNDILSEGSRSLSGNSLCRDSADSLRASSASRKSDLDHTTVMIRHIACRYMEQDVRRILDEEGMAGTYSSVHVPESFSKRSNRGYVFVTVDDFLSIVHLSMHCQASSRERRIELVRRSVPATCYQR